MTAIDPPSIPQSDGSGEAALPAGSVDRNLVESLVWLNPHNESAVYLAPASGAPRRTPRPWLEEIVAELTAGMVDDFQRATALRRWVAGIPRAFPKGGASTRAGFWQDYSTFLRGGTEEEVIRKGTPLAIELARVLVTLATLAGVPGRIVVLAGDDGRQRHTVTELYVRGHWSVFDPVSDRSFIWSKHGYASAWDIHLMPRLVDGLQDHGRLRYVDSRFYQQVAVAAYDPWDERHRFPWQPLDEATRGRLHRGEAG
ncbi:MAG: transglutaminase domain-containing protein [Dehalococcoidia bacterium]